METDLFVTLQLLSCEFENLEKKEWSVVNFARADGNGKIAEQRNVGNIVRCTRNQGPVKSSITYQRFCCFHLSLC